MSRSAVREPLWETALTLLYPVNIYCACCGDAVDPDVPYSLCGRCQSQIRWLRQELPAGDAFPPGGAGNAEIGKAGTADLRRLHRAFSCAVYESGVKEILRKFKYGNRPGLAKPLARLMRERVEGEGLHPDLVAPVPMHRAKERVRGYNQAALLARELSRQMQIPCRCDLLLRTRETGAMSRLSAEERRLNLQNAFQLKDGSAPSGLFGLFGRVDPDDRVELAGRSVLLVDDILTTGTTADECARVLLDAGAATVDLLVFASGGDGKPGRDET